MSTIQLDLEGAHLNTAQYQARAEACSEKDDLRLIAWYDRDRETGEDVAELDPNWVVHVHQDADTEEVANVQGG